MTEEVKTTHTVFTDALGTIGKLIDETAQRDAIHLAVEPAVAAERLFPGQDVGKLTDASGNTGYGTSDAPVGIVDPFLKRPVNPGQRFWLVVYPRQITSLRHVWEHPAFDPVMLGAADKPTKIVSEEWLRNFTKGADCPNFDTLVAVAMGDYKAGALDDYGGEHHQWSPDEYLHFSGLDAHGDIPSEFWDHLENYTGKKPPHRPPYFSCSC